VMLMMFDDEDDGDFMLPVIIRWSGTDNSNSDDNDDGNDDNDDEYLQ